MSALVELNQHYALTPANIIAVDYRGHEPTVIYLDPHGGLQFIELARVRKNDLELPPHFNSTNPMRVDFNYPVIKGFVETSDRSNPNVDPNFVEIHIKGADGRHRTSFELHDINMNAVAQDYTNVMGGVPRMVYQRINGKTTKIITSNALSDADFAKSILALKGQARRPETGSDASKPNDLIT